MIVKQIADLLDIRHMEEASADVLVLDSNSYYELRKTACRNSWHAGADGRHYRGMLVAVPDACTETVMYIL